MIEYNNMKKVISYCLFGDAPRYWSQIPSVLICNRSLHPLHHIRFYLDKNCYNNKLFKLIQDITVEDPFIQYQIQDQLSIQTSGTCWRMKPLWDKDVSIVHCRDMDAIPNTQQVKVVKMFESSNFSGYGMRSHPYHNIPLLAGLCGFNRIKMQQMDYFPSSFDEYIEYGKANCSMCKNWQVGVDQQLLNNFFFYTRTLPQQRKFVDIALDSQAGRPLPLKRGNPTQLLYSSLNSMKIVQDQNILSLCNNNIGKFIGMPMQQNWGFPYKKKKLFISKLLQSKYNISDILNKRIKDNNLEIL